MALIFMWKFSFQLAGKLSSKLPANFTDGVSKESKLPVLSAN